MKIYCVESMFTTHGVEYFKTKRAAIICYNQCCAAGELANLSSSDVKVTGDVVLKLLNCDTRVQDNLVEMKNNAEAK